MERKEKGMLREVRFESLGMIPKRTLLKAITLSREWTLPEMVTDL